MSKFVRTLALFVAGLHLFPSKAASVQWGAPDSSDEGLKGVTLQPLNGKFDNLFAGHSSHSSHRSHSSHSSHYSGSSGAGSRYVAPSPPVATPRVQPYDARASDSVSSPPSRRDSFQGGASTSTESVSAPETLNEPNRGFVADKSVPEEVPMSRAEKLRLQVIRVQIRLNSLGLYNGAISGKFDIETRTALRLFQQVKNFPESGQMTTPTLNALGIPAVR